MSKAGPKELAQRELSKAHKLMLADGLPPALVRNGPAPRLKDRKTADAGVTLAPPFAVQKAIAADLADGPDDAKHVATVNDFPKMVTVQKVIAKSKKPAAIKQTGVTPLAELAKMIQPDKPTGKHAGASKEESSVMRSKKSKSKPVSIAKSANGHQKPDKKRKGDLLLQALKRQNGVTNAELAKIMGARPSASTMRVVCEAHDLKLKIVKKSGEPTRYHV